VLVGNTIDNPNPSGYEVYLAQQLANTYADIVMRENVRRAMMAALSLKWLPEYDARVVANTQLVELSVTDTDPGRARAVANELANQLVRLSPTDPDAQDQARKEFINQQLNDLEASIRNTSTEITEKQQELAGLNSARQIADTQTAIRGLQDKLATLQANYAAMLANTQRGAVNAISIIEPAALPWVPVGPNKMATILLAATIGFVLAVAAAYLLEYLDDTLRTPEDVQASLNLTTIGIIPQVSEQEAGIVMMGDNRSPVRESYRVLRTNLQFAAVDRPLDILLVTSAAPSEGKSMTAANLGAAIAQTGRRVILVDTDLHRPRQHRLFKVRNSVGVTTGLLEDQPTIDDILQETSVPGLRLLTSGPLPPNPAELLGSARMRSLLTALKAEADVVVLDSPPISALSDAAVLSTQADGVVMVLEAGKTRRPFAQRALEALNRVNAHVVGAVLNRVPTRGFGYYYYSDYHYQYDDPDARRRDDGRDDGRSQGDGTAPRGLLRRRRTPAPAPPQPAGSAASKQP
jgi:capsular exopolysaccharide synthesis family protein